MPDHLNRSPCTTTLTVLLQESVSGQLDKSQQLSETRRPERANVILTEATEDGQKVTRFKCNIGKVDIVNRNGRYYPRSAYQAAIDAAQEDLAAGRLWGLLEHADDWYDPMKGRLEKIAGLFDSISIDGDMVIGSGTVVSTPTGDTLRGLLASKVAVGISTSGTGSVKWLPAKEVDDTYHDPEALIGVIQDDFRLLTVDFVSDPANPSGQARSAEQRQRQSPAPTRPQEGTMKWNEKVKKTAERLGMTVEAFAAAHADWANELQTEGTTLPPAARSEGASVSADDYRVLEQTVVELRGQVTGLTTDNHNARRDAIAITALESARLPSAGTIKHGETEIDLDASFRADLIGVARAAENDESAKAAVDRKIVERKAALGQRESAPRPGSGRINLPTGDNSRVATEAERNSQDGGVRRLENTRSRVGLL
ncbi:hypothetical protein QR90_06715 [Deinococcus radiopugnans]|uniref:Uncharacterized protein n=1 Tax=Deinococcus radiopugnans TaxID=57497 RepID=A0A0A7KFG4_9DEIO|nr:hypothetical protein [Deinococcus radiopugnans]AIZ44861.1 hypothetical protein QR90_06715 [Deinococcus radiopugnans]